MIISIFLSAPLPQECHQAFFYLLTPPSRMSPAKNFLLTSLLVISGSVVFFLVELEVLGPPLLWFLGCWKEEADDVTFAHQRSQKTEDTLLAKVRGWLPMWDKRQQEKGHCNWINLSNFHISSFLTFHFELPEETHILFQLPTLSCSTGSWPGQDFGWVQIY